MTTSSAISSGLRATWRAKWMVLLFFGCNLLMAAALAAPMQSVIADHIGNSAIGEQLARGFSTSWLAEFQIANAVFLKSFSIAIVYGAIVFLALNTVLSAGAFEVFAQGEGARLHAFGRGIGKYFLRFARIVLIASLFYFVAFWFWQRPVAALVDRMFADGTVERWHFYLSWVRWALLFITVFSVNLMVEYAKADVVVHERQSAMGALGRGAGFVLANFGRVLWIYVALGILTAASILAYAVFARYFPQSSVATVFIWFVVAQVFVWLRWMFRLSSWGAAVAYYASHRAPLTAPATAAAAPAQA